MSLSRADVPVVENAPQLLMMFVGQDECWQNEPLYRALLDRLVEGDVAAATAMPGARGLGNYPLRPVAGSGTPVAILAVDIASKLKPLASKLRAMSPESELHLVDVQVTSQGLMLPC